jgi:dTDP-4-amino-4,6-dideoxygalactose transaminase
VAPLVRTQQQREHRVTQPPAYPVGRPRLPDSAALLPYLREIDANRYYSNFGPLVQRFQERLTSAMRFVGGDGLLATCANATLGLAAALIAQGARPGDLCLMPSWTFVASPLAAMLAGMTPFFVDVDEEDWTLNPTTAEHGLAAAPSRVGAVMVVAPFGRPMAVAAWDEFARSTGRPVVIDAAAAFDAIEVGRAPVVVSLHATKVLGVGEGGFVASTDHALIRAVARCCNFGFFGSRETGMPAFNAKMSEYHAAVGLAALDRWPETRGEFQRVANAYRRHLADLPVTPLDGSGQRWVAATCVVRFADAPTEEIAARLADSGIETRFWWNRGCHREALFAGLPRMALPVTDALAAATLGLPCYVDLPDDGIAAICAEVGRALVTG